MKEKLSRSLQWKFLLVITVIVFPSLGGIFVWEGIQHEKQVKDQILSQATVLSRMVVLVRQWISDCGGVMVNEKSEGAKNVSCFLDNRMETAKGSFRLFTPAMVTKKLSQYSNREDLYRFRIASLHPLNPENRPDEFERKALEWFADDGVREAFQFHRQGEHDIFHYVVPLYLEKGCLKCHPAQDISRRNIGGGLSVILPVGKVISSTRTDHLKTAVLGMGLIFLMIFTFFILLKRLVIKPMRKFEEMAKEIGEGNLNARVDIRTGDEFEKLAHTFNTMAERISRGRDHLKDRISQATRELSEANRELKTLDKLKSDFLATMSHELRSPLTVIRGGVDYLNRTIKGMDNRKYLHIIDKNLARLMNLVSDIFDSTRIEADSADWAFEQENLTGLVREVVEILEPPAADKRITVDFECSADIFVEMNLERIEQVLVNILENAIKFSRAGGTIEINVRENPESVRVSIKDNGRGISKEHLETVFEKFRTLPASQNRGRAEGAGLGLAICKGIIDAHGGQIWVESEKDEGSTFFFTLPKKQQ